MKIDPDQDITLSYVSSDLFVCGKRSLTRKPIRFRFEKFKCTANPEKFKSPENCVPYLRL